MRGFALFLLIISAVCMAAFTGGLLWFFAAAPMIQAVLAGTTIFLLIVVVALVLQVRHMHTALADFADAAQEHILSAQTQNEDLAHVLEGVAARQASLKRDFVEHLASHEGLKPVQAVSLDQPAPAIAAPENPKQSIASAILANRIDLFVQPTVTLPNRKTVFYECLSRLRSEAGDTLYPSAFLEHAKQSKLIGTLDNFLLLRCVHIIRRLHRKAPLETFFLNISASSLRDPEFYEQFIDFLAGDKTLAEHLVLELQASDLETLLPQINTGLDRLAQAGYRFALDGAQPEDVTAALAGQGFGFAKIPARSIVAHEAPGELLHDLKERGVTVIATHVEDDKTLIALSELGVSHAQGYLIAKPAAWDLIDRQKQLSGAA